MRIARILLILGIWVAILPYLGFPYFWKSILFSATGLVIVYFGYLLFREARAASAGERAFDNFSENKDFDDAPEQSLEAPEVAEETYGEFN